MATNIRQFLDINTDKLIDYSSPRNKFNYHDYKPRNKDYQFISESVAVKPKQSPFIKLEDILYVDINRIEIPLIQYNVEFITEESKYKKLFDILGFTIQDLQVIRNEQELRNVGGYIINGAFHGNSYIFFHLVCPCGRKEYGFVNVEKFKTSYTSDEIKFDPYKYTYKVGAISPQHLRDDGFDEEFVKECEIKYKQAVNELLPEFDLKYENG